MKRPSRPCPVCGGPAAAQPVYKHRWWVCAACGNASRERREHLPVDRLPEPIQRRVPPGLRFDAAVLAEPERALFTALGGSYEGEAERFLRVLDDLHAGTSGAILDLGGGPGFVAAALADRADRVVMTDYSRRVLDFARGLGVEARRFDFHGDPLDAVVQGPFDLVLSRFGLNYCADLPKLAGGIGAVAAADATLVLSFILPTRGALLTSALEDAGPVRLWAAEHVAAAFAEQGFLLTRRFEPCPPMPYWRPRGGRYRLFSLPWELAPGPLPRDTLQRHAGLLFRRGR